MAGHSKIRMTLTATAVVSLVITAVALGATRTTTTPVPAGTAASGTVNCPTGKVRLLGIEGNFDEFGGTQSDLPSKLVRPTSSSVLGSARNFSSTTNGSFDTLAKCGQEPALHPVQSHASLDPAEQDSLVAHCPRGTSVRLGGFAQALTESGPFVMVNGLERDSDRRWEVSALNEGFSAGRLQALAYCAPGSPTVHAVHDTVDVRDDHFGTAKATCPQGEGLMMGGLKIQHYQAGQGDIDVVGMRPVGRRSWAVRGFKVIPHEGRLTAIAYCH